MCRYVGCWTVKVEYQNRGPEYVSIAYIIQPDLVGGQDRDDKSWFYEAPERTSTEITNSRGSRLLVSAVDVMYGL